jgi:hypothetical protein
MKVAIGLGSIWGLFAFGILLVGSFTLGLNDTLPEIIAITLYGLTILPSCVLAIWFRKYAAFWLIALTPVAAFGFIYQVIAQHNSDIGIGALIRGIISLLIIALIPALIGLFLLRADTKKIEQ